LVGEYDARIQAAQAASAALDTAIAQIQTYAPGFLRPLDLAAVRSIIPDPQTALISFCCTSQGSLAFILTSAADSAVQVVEIPAGLTDDRLRKLLLTKDANGQESVWLSVKVDSDGQLEWWQQTMDRTLAQLGDRLLHPALAALGSEIKRLLLLPSGALFLLPLHAVPLADGSGRICDRYEVRYAPSAQVLFDLATRPAATTGIANSLYEVINPTSDFRLVGTAVEGTAIAGLFPGGHVQIAYTGTEAEVIAGAPGHTYVHFACHASYDRSEPAQSGLALADGMLTLGDLQRGVVDLSAARLVTLSACESGISDIIQGSPDEYVGLPAGFLLEGVPNVVSSLWSVPDISTALLMQRFYDNHINKQLGLAAALREAQLWLQQLSIGELLQRLREWKQQADEYTQEALYDREFYYQVQADQDKDLQPFAHPYFWAAFTVHGLGI
jgi:CHAT domain-containing protein